MNEIPISNSKDVIYMHVSNIYIYMDTYARFVINPPSLMTVWPPWFRKFISKMKIVIFLGVLIIGVVWGSEVNNFLCVIDVILLFNCFLFFLCLITFSTQINRAVYIREDQSCIYCSKREAMVKKTVLSLTKKNQCNR